MICMTKLQLYIRYFEATSFQYVIVVFIMFSGLARAYLKVCYKHLYVRLDSVLKDGIHQEIE